MRDTLYVDRGDVICYVESDYDLAEVDTMFFGIGEVISVHPHRGAVGVRRYHCTTTSWGDALESDTRARYTPICPLCSEAPLVVIPIQNIISAPVHFVGEQFNALDTHTIADIWIHLCGRMYDTLRRPLGPNALTLNRHTVLFGRAPPPAPTAAASAAATTDEDLPRLESAAVMHMDYESCPSHPGHDALHFAPVGHTHFLPDSAVGHTYRRPDSI